MLASFMRASKSGAILIIVVPLLWASFGFEFARDNGRTMRAFASDVATLLDVQDKALSADGGRRILLAGGSNVLYGVSAAELSDSLSVPVVNMGLPQLAFDADRYFRLLEHRARAGDVVILSLTEWFNPTATNAHGEWIPVIWSASPSISPEISADDTVRAALTRAWRPFPAKSYLARALSRSGPATSATNWHHVTAVGDLVACQSNPAFGPLAKPTLPREAEWNKLRTFAATMKARGVHVVLDIPWIMADPLRQGIWLRHLAELRRKMDSIAPVIPSDAERLLWSGHAHFCDTPSHLNAEGRRLRTASIAQYLRTSLAGLGSPAAAPPAL